MNDRKLLELAAKAAVIAIEYVPSATENIGGSLKKFKVNAWHGPYLLGTEIDWNPLTNDGDALRLVVKLRLTVDRSEVKDAVFVYCDYQDNFVEALEEHGTDPYAATRRAIVRAAAEIGKKTK